jgi:hypothetical protein
MTTVIEDGDVRDLENDSDTTSDSDRVQIGTSLQNLPIIFLLALLSDAMQFLACLIALTSQHERQLSAIPKRIKFST